MVAKHCVAFVTFGFLYILSEFVSLVVKCDHLIPSLHTSLNLEAENMQCAVKTLCKSARGAEACLGFCEKGSGHNLLGV